MTLCVCFLKGVDSGFVACRRTCSVMHNRCSATAAAGLAAQEFGGKLASGGRPEAGMMEKGTTDQRDTLS